MTVRKVTDPDLLVRLRIDFIFDGKARPADITPLQENLRSYFARHLAAGDFLALAAEENGEILSAAFLTVSEAPPRSAEPFIKGTVYNVYTYPVHRRKGCAKALMTALLTEAHAMGVTTVDLLASHDGEPLYRSLGFSDPAHRFLRLSSH